MLIDAIVALGFAMPPIIFALAAYRRADAAVIWAKRRHPRTAVGASLRTPAERGRG